MKADVLAAGRGSRLGDITKNQPKPTIQFGGKSVVERIVDRLHTHGITEIIINTHYLPTMITDKVSANALYFYEEQLLGHMGTIMALKNWLQDDNFFVCNGDTISTVNYRDMIRVHKPDTISVLMEEYRACGTWLYDKAYFDNPDIPIIPYRPTGLSWWDIGTPERLEAAKLYFEGESK